MLIGITGTNGAGKGAVVEYLVSAKGFSRYSARAVIMDEVRARHLSKMDKDTMRDVANELRKEHGAAYVIEQLYAMAEGEGNIVLESVRTIGEAEFLKGHGAHILAVDADKKTRYERITERGTDDDQLTFEEFSAREDREMASSDPWDMNVFGVMQLADAEVTNNGTLEELHLQVDEALRAFPK
jgi:dephospho-CoA kinase